MCWSLADNWVPANKFIFEIPGGNDGALLRTPTLIDYLLVILWLSETLSKGNVEHIHESTIRYPSISTEDSLLLKEGVRRGSWLNIIRGKITASLHGFVYLQSPS